MRCPKCECVDDKVIDSRASRGETTIRRRRECLKCGHRFTTYEEIEKSTLVVIKRDERRENFSREKLLISLQRACQKRPVSLEAMQALADKIFNDLLDNHDREVSWRELGECVMEGLRGLDKVAYIRYASIYRQFEEPDEFLHEIKKLEKPHDTLTIRLPGV